MAETEDNFIQRVLAGQARQKICRLHKASGWSLQELAARSGLNAETLKDLEDGRKPMSPYHLRKILDAFQFLEDSSQ